MPVSIDLPPPITVDSDDDLPFMELALDPATGDLAVPIAFLRGAAAFAQRLTCRLRMFRGEWFLDKRQGFPYIEAVLRKNPDLALVGSLFRRAILSTPGALSILQFELNLDSPARVLTIDPLEILVTGGKVFRAQPGQFVVPLPEEANRA